MTKEKYLNEHIQHRLDLLTIFRKRFKNETDETINEKDLGDYYKCSKDISVLMARFLMTELGIKLQKGKKTLITLNDNNDRDIIRRINDFEIIRLYPDNIPSDIKEELTEILIAANRAVSHIDEIGVDHPLKSHNETIKYLIPVIDFIENKVNSNIYKK